MTPEQKAAKKAYDAARYLAKREEIRCRNDAWKAANPERYRAAIEKWRNENAERDAETKRDYARRNRERINRLAVLRRQRNPERFKAALKRYRLRNPEHNRTRKGVRKIPKGTIRELLLRQQSRCAACRSGLSSGFHVDHIMPLALGGAHERRNFQILCAPCNQSKFAKHPIDFMRSKGMLL